MYLKGVRLILVFFWVGSKFLPGTQPIQYQENGFIIKIDSRMELLSSIQILTDGVKMKQLTPFIHQYYTEMLNYFEPYREHPAVKWFNKNLHQDWNGDAPVQTMLIISPPPNIRVLLPFSDYLIKRGGGKENLDKMVYLLNRFSKDSNFMNFWRNHRLFYSLLLKRTKDLIPFNQYIHLMTEFYGEKKAKYIFIPVPIFMNGGWGLRIQTVEGEISHYIGGPHGLQGRFPVFNKDRLRYLVFHEFGHSFVNPLVHEHMNQINKYKHLFSYMKEDMAKLTYPNWEVTVFEHIVRAGETLLLEIAGFKDQSQRAYQRSINSGFVMLPQFRDKMVLYQKNREKYPTFRSFFPELLEVLQDDYNFSHKKRP